MHLKTIENILDIIKQLKTFDQIQTFVNLVRVSESFYSDGSKEVRIKIRNAVRERLSEINS